MTPPPGSGAAASSRAPLPLLVLLYAIPFVVAAITPISDFRGPQGDLGLYLDKAAAISLGLAPYRDVPLEYPPFALVPMVLPLALWPFGPPSLTVYAWLFAGQMAVFLVALALVVGRIVRIRATWPRDTPVGAPAVAPEDVRAEQRRVGIRLLILAAGASLALTWRFDLFPVLLATVGLWAALEHRPVAAGAAIGAGILAKLFPLVLGPALAVAWMMPRAWFRLNRIAQFVGAVGVVVVGGMLPFVVVAGYDAFAFVGYQSERGLQIESVGGGLVLFWGLLSGDPITLQSPFSAWEVTGTLARAVLALTSAALFAGLGALALLAWPRARAEAARDGSVSPATIVTLATAAILVLVLTSKVFSIQYVVWVVPFAALLPARKFWLAAAAVALTIPIHPVLYEALVRQEALPILVLNLRNALLTALLGWTLWDLARPAGLEPTTFRSAT
jgi:hypothetical protein